MVRIIHPGGRKLAPKNRESQPRQRLQGQVEALASDGRGVVRMATGQVVLVARVWPGELVEFSLADGQPARLEGVLEASPERRVPPCSNFAVCGGCAWQMVSENAQTQAKHARVQKLAQQLGLECEVKPVWAAPEPLGYRNRAQLKTDGVKLGFIGVDGSSLCDVSHCPVLNPATARALSQLRAELPNRHWRGRGGKLRSWHIDDQLPPRLDSRQPFRQGNSDQNQRMRAWLAGYFSSGSGRQALELFAGSGNFTEVLSAAGAQVLAVEAVAEALAAAPELTGVEWLAADLFSATGLQMVAARAGHCVDLLLDPPRAGFQPLIQLLSVLPALERVFYISCDPATFARDIAPVTASGWQCLELQPVDLFPQTPHIEILSVFTRRS